MSAKTLKVRKAVFPVAGLGTRFLPATKAMPKEMLTVVDKPLIQYAVEMATRAGIEELVFVTGRGKSAIENHFDRPYELTHLLQKKGKLEELRAVTSIIPPHCRLYYTRQGDPLGLGHAVLCARSIIGDEPFVVILPDDILDARENVIAKMIAAYQKTGKPVVLTMDVPPERTRNYGIVDPASSTKADKNGMVAAKGFVEKPDSSKAPSTLAVIGSYVLTPDVFDVLAKVKPGHGGEIQLTDALNVLAKKHGFLAHILEGERFDCGDKVGFQMANLYFALKDPWIAERLWPFLDRVVDGHRHNRSLKKALHQ